MIIEVITQAWNKLSPTWKCLVILGVLWRALLEFMAPSSLRSILWQFLCLAIGAGIAIMVGMIQNRMERKRPSISNGPTTDERKTETGPLEPSDAEPERERSGPAKP